MTKYLIQTQEIYRTENEISAQDLIAEAKKDMNYELIKYNCEHKEKKSKGDIVDDWYKVTLVKRFNDEKDPTNTYNIAYEVES